MFKNLLQKEIEKELREMLGDTAEAGKFSVEACDPALQRGDFATNAAFAFAKEFGKNPRELAEEIQEKLEKIKTGEKLGGVMNCVEKIEIAGAGFVNFYLKPEVFVSHIAEILKQEEMGKQGKQYGKNEVLAGKKVMVEYTDPNPFKEFHIGHLVPNTIGESISRLVEWSGAETKRVNYQGDVGMHVAKAVWGMKNAGLASLENAQDLGQAYAFGARAYEEDEKAKKEITVLNKKIYERDDEEINTLYDFGRKISLEHFETLYQKLGTKFDYSFFESETGVVGKKIVEENTGENGKKVFEKGEGGAVVFPGEKYGLHTRVFLNSEGLPTYEAKELGLAKVKYEACPVREFPWEPAKQTEAFLYDISLVVAASEVSEYFKVLLAAMREIFPKLAEKTHHIANGILKLPTGKMSSRTGDIIPAESLIARVREMVQEKIQERELGENEKNEIAEKVAVGAIKFSILRGSTGKDIIFDFEKSISFEGDSGPYLQYTLARAFSVLRKGQEQGVAPNTQNAMFENSHLEKLLFERFPETLERAAREYEPHHLCTYLLELASAFNSYYAQNQIVKSEDTKQSSYRLALTQAVAIILKNGLTVLGMPVLEKM